MANKLSLKTKLKFWFMDIKAFFAIAVITLVIAAVLLAINFRMVSENLEGVAQEYMYVASDLGNKTKLAVTLNNGNLVYVGVQSPAQVSVGSEVCLRQYKTLLGLYRYRLKNVGKCT